MKLKFEEKVIFFNKIGLKDWKIVGDLKGGGQSHTLIVKRSDGVDGVFRYLKSSNEIDIKRFHRELQVLIEPKYKHKNVVELLDWPKDSSQHWYISRLGNSFPEYWDDFRKRNQTDFDKILKRALEIILELLDGLSQLHANKLVHRDIKPLNIVMQGEIPQLIDFGLVYVSEEERLTPLDGAVGNYRYSHDLQMNRMEYVPPWLDIFQLSQLLIWMVQERPVKEWSRSLHWAYVNYPPSMSENNVVAIRALTASCTNPNTSPVNAEDLKKLINILFIHQDPSTSVNFDFFALKVSVKATKAKLILNLGSNFEQLEDSKPLFTVIFDSIRKIFEQQLVNPDLQESILSKDVYQLEEFIKHLYTLPKLAEKENSTLIEVCFGNAVRNFSVSLNFCFLPPSLGEKNIDNFIPWGIGLITNVSHDEIGRRYFEDNKLRKTDEFRINKTGEIFLIGPESEPKRVSLEEVGNIIYSYLFDPKLLVFFDL